MKLVSGTKYRFMMYSVLRAPAIESGEPLGSGVPDVGVVSSDPAAPSLSS